MLAKMENFQRRLVIELTNVDFVVEVFVVDFTTL